MEIRPYIFEPVSDAVIRKNDLVNPPDFTESFAQGGSVPGDIQSEIDLTENDIKEAEERGYKRGLEEGKADMDAATMEVEKKVVSALDVVSQKMETLFESYDNSLKESSNNSVRLALMIAKKVAGEALKTSPEDAVMSIVKQSIKHLYSEPEINISINTALVGSIEEKIKKMAKEKRFDGKIIFHGDDNIDESDCLIDWADGGAGISREEIWHKIENIIETTGIDLSPPQEESDNVADAAQQNDAQKSIEVAQQEDKDKE